jgi:Lysine-specific metallo-endopeptidase
MRAAEPAPAAGRSASTVANGRRLFNDSRGSTSTEGGGGVSVGAVTASGMRFNTDARSVTVKGGNQEQTDKIWTAVSKARVMLDTALGALMGADSLPEKSMAALDANFHNVDRSSYPTRVSHLYDIRESFATTRKAFDGDIPLEVEDEADGNTEGYVRDWYLWKSDIHLHPLWFSQGLTERARIIVHEACHKYDNDDDHAYYWQSGYAHLTVKEAIDNADSYATFCRDVM